MSKFDFGMLKAAMAAVDKTISEKKAFVPMPGGGTEPVAGASQATAAIAGGGMDPSQGAVDAQGVPIDPNTGLPIDPNAMPVDPASQPPQDPGMAPMPTPPDPSAGGMPMHGADGMITMPVSQFITLIQTLGVSGGGKKGAGKEGTPQAPDMQSQISSIHQALTNAGMIGAPAQQPAQ